MVATAAAMPEAMAIMAATAAVALLAAMAMAARVAAATAPLLRHARHRRTRDRVRTCMYIMGGRGSMVRGAIGPLLLEEELVDGSKKPPPGPPRHGSPAGGFDARRGLSQWLLTSVVVAAGCGGSEPAM